MSTSKIISLSDIQAAREVISGTVLKTQLTHSNSCTMRLGAQTYLKYENEQLTGSFKIRGAYNKVMSLSKEELKRGVVACSAGNHAQGVALSASKAGASSNIVMPSQSSIVKILATENYGADVILHGNYFDESFEYAKSLEKELGYVFIHPYNDPHIMAGQGTIALEILAQSKTPVDYLFLPVGGGGLAAGVSSIFKELSPNTKIIGVEPKGAPSMSVSIINGFNTKIDNIDKFTDGASVQKVGDLNFEICKENLDEMVTVHEGKVCQTILDLYNKNAIVVEPAGALTTAVLDQFSTEIKGKNVVCLISGSNNDITRTEEIKERALLHSGHKHYFIIKFPQRAGALREFLIDILGPNDDITHFEYSKKNNRDSGPAIVGLEIANPNDIDQLIVKMRTKKFFGEYLNDKPDLFQVLV